MKEKRRRALQRRRTINTELSSNVVQRALAVAVHTSAGHNGKWLGAHVISESELGLVTHFPVNQVYVRAVVKSYMFAYNIASLSGDGSGERSPTNLCWEWGSPRPTDPDRLDSGLYIAERPTYPTKATTTSIVDARRPAWKRNCSRRQRVISRWFWY